MSQLNFVALLLAVIGPLLALARLVRLPESLVLLGAGAGATLLPGVPALQIDPQLALGLFLPPLLYASTVRVSFHLLRFTVGTGLVVGTVLSLATVGAVMLLARWLFPGLSWAGAALFGAIAALFDTRLFHEAQGRPHVPRALADALKTREMVARVIALATFAIAVKALSDAPPSPLEALGRFVYSVAGGIVAGLLIGRAVAWLRERLDPAPVEIAVSIASPYLAAVAARMLDLSVVTSVMAAALTVSALRTDPRTGATGSSSEARISAMAFWEEISLLLSAVLFFLAGQALPQAVRGLESRSVWQVALAAALILGVVLAVQFVTARASTALPALAPALRDAHGAPVPRGRAAGLMVWASTRSVIGLILALSIPTTLPDGQPFAERGLILVVMSFVILGSVLLQGLTLTRVVRAVGLDSGGDEREQQAAERTMTQAHEAVAATHDREGCFAAERRALLAMRRRNRIGDEVLRRMLRETDLRARAAEHDALPGAGPPNP